MTSETLDPIDWPVPPPPTQHRAVPPEHVLHGANADHKLQDLLQSLGHERATIGMPGQHCLCGRSGYMYLIKPNLTHIT